MPSSVRSVDELLATLAAIDGQLPPTDGVACFNRMYRQVTEAVREHLQLATFGDPAWLARLDVLFGNLSLDAIEAPAGAPRAWLALIERREDTRVTPLQFALAGLNAHINRDLPLAVVQTCLELNTAPDAADHHTDFLRVNSILAVVEPAIRASFQDDLLREVDRKAPGLQSVVANFKVVKARETAWSNALTLWTLRRVSADVQADFLDGLDHLVGFAGRGLLVPLA